MPYIKIEVTREEVTEEQKQALIKGVTGLIGEVLNKDPQLTSVVIRNMIWTTGVMPEKSIGNTILNTMSSSPFINLTAIG